MIIDNNQAETAENILPSPGAKSLFVCVGDVSADRHAARVISRLKEEMPDLCVWGVGGEAMQAAGARILFDRNAINAFGIMEVIRHLPRLALVRKELLEKIEKERPDAVLLMDFGGFNIGFAQILRKKFKDLPIIYFISPQVWGSRPWRIKAIAASASKMLVIFPFEEELYRARGVNACFVGHPLTTGIKPADKRCSKEDFCRQFNLDPERPIIGVFPGSRRQEIGKHGAIVLQAIDLLRKARPQLQFVVSRTDSAMGDAFQHEIEKGGYERLLDAGLKIIESQHNEELMCHADLLWTKSGTTTLEATLIGTPMIIFYNASWITYLIFTLFKTVRYVGWPNLLNGEELVPELILLDCSAQRLAAFTLDWLDVPGLKREISARLKVLKSHLGRGDFTDNAACEIITILRSSQNQKTESPSKPA